MSESDFERPGATGLPAPPEWPYHAPSPDASPTGLRRESEPLEAVVVETDGDRRDGPANRRWLIALVAGIVGALVGGIVAAVMMQPEPDLAPLPISLSTFPNEFMGSKRNDLQLREAGFGPTIDRLDKEFEDQLASFRFAYGGRGATFGYGREINLTIVDGILAPDVPRDGEMDLGGRVRETRRFISLAGDTVSCTFEPHPVRNANLGMEDFGDLSGIGRSECVLVDLDRHLSLSAAHNPRVRGSSAQEAASTFSEALERLHAQLVA